MTNARIQPLVLLLARRHVLREVLVHMIEEYARHDGHADFL